MAAADEVRAYLRLEAGPEDALIDALVAAAIATGEAFLGQVIVRRAIIEILPARREWTRLAATPVVAIGAVEGIGAALAMDGHAIDIDAAGDGWVRVTAPGVVRVRVTATAGLADDWAGVPAGIAQGVVRLAAHMFAHRDDAGAGAGPPAAVAALWRPWRRMRLHVGHAA